MTSSDTETECLAKMEAVEAHVEASRARLSRQDFTVPEVAVILGVSRNAAYEAVKAGVLGHYRVGRNIRITQAHLSAFRAGTTDLN